MYESPNDFTPFVVVGSAKSGTTWMQRLLDSHPDVRCHFQMPIFPLKDRSLWHTCRSFTMGRSRSPFSGVFSDHDAETVYGRMHDIIVKLDLLQPHWVKQQTMDLPDHLRSSLEQRFTDLTAHTVRRLLKDTSDKAVIGTKAYTDLSRYFDVFPEGKVIHIIRDGRDVCVSKRFHFLRMGVYYLGEEKSALLRFLHRFSPSRRVVGRLRRKLGWFGENWFITPGTDAPLFTGESLTKYAEDWKRVTHYNLEFQRKRPSQILPVRYERLKENGESELKRVFEFLGCTSDDATVSRIISGNAFEKQKKSGSSSFFRKGISGDWRNHFTPVDIELFKSIAGDLLVELGYEMNNNWSE